MTVLANVIGDYPTRTAQIKIVNHDVNKGLPTARRSGLAIATGDYVIHCDSDDRVDKTMYQKLLEKAENEYEKFKEQLLEANPNLKIFLVDERLTTVMANRSMLEADISRGKRHKVIDQQSAVIILESFLNSQEAKDL